MKVAIFTSSFFPHVGGLEEMVRQLAHEQVRQGDDPLIVANRWPKSLPETDTFEGLPVKRFVFRVPERTWKQLGGAALYGPSTLRRICAAVRAHGAEVLHVNCVSSNCYYALWVKRLTGLPLVVTSHAELTMDATGLFQRSRFAQGLMRRALTEADAVTACSLKTLRDAEAFLGRPLGPRGSVIYNGIPAPSVAAPAVARPPYILALGRLVPQKGFDVLLHACADLRRRGIASHDLLIAGDGPDRAQLETLRDSLGLNAAVTFLGQQGREQVTPLIAGAACVVLSSRGDEGLPMVLLEAMGAGRPVVATRVGGVPELVVDGETGLLADREDPAALAAALARLLSDAPLQARMAAAAARRGEAFRWPALAGQYAAVYRAVTAACAPRRSAS